MEITIAMDTEDVGTAPRVLQDTSEYLLYRA